MGAQVSYFLCPVAGGLPIAPNTNGSIQTFHFDPSQIEWQQWFLEQEGTKVAFRNRKSSRYLRAEGASVGCFVTTGEKQFWSLETGSTPRSYWIKSEAYPGLYLCNPMGAFQADNLTIVSNAEPAYAQTMLWYMFDFETWRAHVNSSPQVSFAGPPGEQEQKAAQAKQQELENKVKESEAKENASKEREQQFAAKEKELGEKQKQAEDRQKELEKRQQQFEAQAKAAQEKQSQVEARERDLAKKEASSGKGEKKSSSQVSELQRQLSAMQKQLEESRAAQHETLSRDEDLKKREQQLAQANEAVQAAQRELAEKQAAVEKREKEATQAQNDFATRGGMQQSATGLQDPKGPGALNRTAPSAMRTVGSRLGMPRPGPPSLGVPREFKSIPRLLPS